MREEGKNPFVLDSKEPAGDYKDFIHGEIRYSQLMNVFPDHAPGLYDLSAQYARERYRKYKMLADNEVF